LADVPLDLPVHGDALGGQLLGDGLLAADEVVGVALVVLVADADQAHLDGLALTRGGLGAAGSGLAAAGGLAAAAVAAAGSQAHHHGAGQEQCKQFSLLHVQVSSFDPQNLPFFPSKQPASPQAGLNTLMTAGRSAELHAVLYTHTLNSRKRFHPHAHAADQV